MLTAAILVPLFGALALALWPGWRTATARIFGVAVAAIPLVLLAVAWTRFDPAGPRFQLVTDVPWIPAIGAGYRIGVDGIALVLAALSALLYVAAIAYPVHYRDKARQYVAWMLFLEGVSIAFFLALDLLLFYVCFDLSLLGMYFLILLWGHEDRQRAALKFLLYTFAGSLVMLLGILSLVLAMDPLTFDMRALIDARPLAVDGVRASVTFAAIMIGLFVKTPVVPLHTWLPTAHVEAPSPASTILAGVLLKMGTFGMIRIAFGMMPATFGRYAYVVAVLAVVGIVYGAFVALGQRHIKRRIAYTSVTHMGYTVLGIAMAASLGDGHDDARRLALDGATLEMVAHGLITGALFLIVGSLWRRGESFEMDDYGGLAKRAPRLTAAMVVASFASLGLPGLAGFVAEFQIFAGAVAIEPWLAGIALIGVVVTAALFIQLLHKVFFGETSERSAKMGDLSSVETATLAALLGLTIWIGLAPAPLMNVIDPASRAFLHSPEPGRTTPR